MKINYTQTTAYLDIRTWLPQSADLAFIFGTRHPTPAEMAAQLLIDQIVQYVVLTGGITRHTGANEAQAHQEILLAQGVSPDHIILEDQSSNTLENVTYALPKIAARLSLDRINSIIVITKWYHIRRSIMTLKRHLPDGIRYYAHTYEPPKTPLSGWWLDGISRGRVLKEWENIPEYLAKGDIAEIQKSGEAFS